MTDTQVIDPLRTDALQIFQAGVHAADPYQAVQNCLSYDNDNLEILLDPADRSLKRVGSWRKIHLIAVGKAAYAMANATQHIIPAHLLAEPGLVITNYENAGAVANMMVIGAGHPLPDAAGLAAAKYCMQRIQSAQAQELVLVLLSGGGSALLPYPVDSITLAEKIAVTDALLCCGASIKQINCVRKHLSKIKGGELTRLAAPADVHALILSDVLGDDVSAIASGPTVPDPSTYADAAAILKSHNIWQDLPVTVQAHLQQGLLGNIPETPKADDPIFTHSGYTLIGSNTVSLHAVAKAAQSLGYATKIYNNQLCGEAKTVAADLVLYAKHLQDQGITEPIALVAGGETTVTVTGNGLGGRNQELALAFAIAAQRQGLSNDWTFLSAGTDGRDGPTDAAGAIVNPGSLQRIRNAGLNPSKLLANNDAYHALNAAADLIISGATGTNVADLQVLLLQPNHPDSIHN